MAQATLALHAPETPDEAVSARPPRVRNWLRWALAAFLAIGTVGWFSPALIGRSALRHRLVHAIVPAYPGSAKVGTASLGWLTPVVLGDVTLSDSDGGEFLRIEEVRTSRSLAALLLAPGNDLGTVTIKKPEGFVRIEADGSNLEETVQSLLEGEGSTSGLKIVVEEGRLNWTALGGDAAAAGIEAVHATVVRAAGAAVPSRVEVEGRLTDGETGGEFSARLTPGDGGASEGSVSALEVPIAAIQPWLDRFQIPVGVSGRISADLVGQTTRGEGMSITADGRIDGRRVWVSCRPLLGDETLQVDSFTLNGRATSAENRLTLETLELRSELGTASVTGRLSPASLAGGTDWNGRLDRLLEQDVVLTASLDLARIAPALKRTLRLRHPIESGRLDIEFQTVEADGGRRGVARVRTADLVAGSADQRVIWREPLTADLALRRGETGIVVERLGLQSEGVSIEGSGSLLECEARFEADLDRLRGQLARFVDLPEGTLAGRASGRIGAKRTGTLVSPRVRLDASAGVQNLSVAVSGRSWTERDLSLTANAEIALEELRIVSIKSGMATLQSVEGDVLTAVLTEPAAASAAAAWPLETTLKGDLGRWEQRARAWTVPLLPLGWTANGALDLAATVRLASDAVAVTTFSGEARELRMTLPDRTLEEPYVRLTGNGEWTAKDGTLALPSATLVSETLSAKATNVRLPLVGGASASGTIAFRGGAGRLMRYVLPAQPSLWLSGILGGQFDLESDAKTISANGRLTFEKPVLSRAVQAVGGKGEWSPIWSDGEASVAISGRYRHADDSLELKSLGLAATGFALDATGRINRVTTAAETDVTGSLDIDWEPFAARVTAGLPGDLAARGRAKKPFFVRGPLMSGGGISPELLASAAVAWERIHVAGTEVGTGELSGRLERRVLNFAAVDWPVAGGHVRGAASVALADAPLLTVAPGRVAEGIHLTPELCRTWLRYAAPSLADAAEAQGVVSFDVQSCQVPLIDPQGMAAGGVLVIQGAEATPGPLARSMLDIVRQIQSITGRDPTNGSDLQLVVPAQEVRVSVTGGRVSHDRFAVRLGDADGPVITTSGSVGFDESVNLIAEVPLDPKWFKEERVASALGGQTLRIPIRGTLGRPALDPRAFQDLARRAAAGAVNGLIDRQIEKQLGDPLRKLLNRDAGEP